MVDMVDCPCCSGTGIIEGESCLTCIGGKLEKDYIEFLIGGSDHARTKNVCDVSEEIR